MTSFFFRIFLHIFVLQAHLCIGNSALLDENSRIYKSKNGYLPDKLAASNFSSKLDLSDHRRRQKDVKKKLFLPGSTVSDRQMFWKQPTNASMVADRSIVDVLLSEAELFQETHAEYKMHMHKVLPSDLFIVAALLARHKYTGHDPRKNNSSGIKNFHRNFPVPPLVALHPIVSGACEKSFSSCIKEIREFIEPRSPQTSSLESKIERFEFLTTASYYMCWYTMQRVRDLHLLDRASQEQFQCLDFNTLHIERSEYSEPRIVMSQPSGHPSIEDVRLSRFRRPYLCAELSFCPDHCYGRETQGVVKDIRRDEGNPCFGQSDSWCSIDPKKNTDFNHLMRNDFNYSCRCEDTHVGFTWDKNLELCVDVDECEEGIDNCAENMICQNTVGSFQCVCIWGYFWNGQLCAEVTKSENKLDAHKASSGPGESTKFNMKYEEAINNCAKNMNSLAGRRKKHCICTQGFHWSGFSCTKLQVRSNADTVNNSCRHWSSSRTSSASNLMHPIKIQRINVISMASFHMQISATFTAFCCLYIL